MSKQSIIPEDYDSLVDEYKTQKRELENFKQQVYDSTRLLKINESLLIEYQSEIEQLRSSEASEKKKYESRITTLEESIQNIRTTHSENQQLFEAELAKKEKENLSLKSELEVAKKVAPTSLDITNSYFEDLQFLNNENDMLKESYNELKEKFEVVQQQYKDLEQTVDQYKDEMRHLRDNVDIKREELSEKSDVIDKLTEELACTKNELASLKLKPLDQESKGNSLFAEVDDRRVHLQQTYNSMKSDYVRMKQELTQHQKIVSSLRKQNAELCDKWKKDVEEIEEDRLLIKKSYKDSIYTLEQLVEKLHKDLAVKPHNVQEDLCAEYNFYTNMIKSKEEEIRELERKINKNSLHETGMAMELAQAHRETRKWHNEAMKLSQEKEIQRVGVTRDSGNFKAPLPVQTEKPTPLKSCIKPTKSETYKNVLQESQDNSTTQLEEEYPENVTQNDNFEESEISNLDLDGKENIVKRGVKFCSSTSDEIKFTQKRKGASRVFDLNSGGSGGILKKGD